jgi:signal transduction histidine kinase/ligand-binding sensor domain-containing protein
VIQVHAQSGNLVFKHITRASGLPVDEVTCLAQDSTGFIWIGSKEGLFRFDGFSYKKFYHEPGNLQTIPNNYISKLYVDKEGLIWVGTVTGMALMKNNGQILRVLNAETESLFSKNLDWVFDIQEHKNIIWISTGNGMFSCRKKGNQITTIQKHDLKKNFKYSTNQFGSFVIDSKSRLWICTLHGLVIYDPDKKELFHSGNNPSSLNILKDKSAFRSLIINEGNRILWYSTWEPSVRVFNMDANKVNTIYSGKGSDNPDFANLINQFLKDDHGTVWMATGKGIKTLNRKNDNYEQSIHYQTGNLNSINSDYVTSLLQDKEGSIWAATSEGISIAQPYKQSFVNLSGNSVEEYPFAKSAVNIIIPVNANSFLIGTYGGDGLYRTDASFKVQEHYSFGSVNYDWIWKHYTQGNNIYISTQKGNLLYDTITKKLKKLTAPPFDQFYPISSFVAGKDSIMWMSQYSNNFQKYNPTNKQFKVYNLSEIGEEPAIVHLARDNDNNLWILTTTSGLLKFDEAKEKITERLVVNKKNGLLETNILFLKDIGEELLIGYVSKGISLYHKKNKSYRHFSRSDGLISNSVTDALQTDERTVWITTRNGLSRFNIKTKTFLNYNYDNGILQNDFQSITQLPDGRLAAGSAKGLVHFFPDKLNLQQKLLAPVITGINVYGKDFPVDSFSVTNPLHIFYNKNYFSFEYISLQYLNNQQIEYAYMLDGFDKDWVHAGNRRFASYANLPGGNYTLKLRARLPGSNWIETSSGLSIFVETPLYKQWWFIPLLFVLALLIAYALFRYRLQQLLRMERLRAAISSDLHDEVGATLSSISIFSEMAKQTLPFASKTEPYLQRIGDRSRDSIEKMSDIIWSINPENDSLQQMLIRMKNFVNETVEGKEVAVHWQESEMIARLKLGMAERKNFYLLFKEAIINAVKYANAKNISVQISIDNKIVSLKVSDDGKGFSFESIKPGNGIKNMKQRALLLNGEATINSSPGKGTTVHVQFRH